MNNVIYLFGPSCSGKSTLGRALYKNLGDQWMYIDRDDLIERNRCSESMVNTILEEKIQSIKNNIIIDAQIPWRPKRKGELYFLVLPPLKILLERDNVRTIQLNRSAIRAHHARKYVIETHTILSNMKRDAFDRCFDSSQESVQNEMDSIKTLLNIKTGSLFCIKYICISVVGLIFNLIFALFVNKKRCCR